MPTTTPGKTVTTKCSRCSHSNRNAAIGSAIVLNGHFIGIHAHGGIYQVAGIDMPWGIWKGLKDHRYKGHFYGAGISYGYQWIMSKHWNIEANIGVGYARVKYEQFSCVECGGKLGEGYKNYFGPTKASLSLIYLF